MQQPAFHSLVDLNARGWAGPMQWNTIPRSISLKCRDTGLATPGGGRYRRLKEHLTRGNCLNICRFEPYHAREIEIYVLQTTLFSGSHTLVKKYRLQVLFAVTRRQNGLFPSRCRAGLAWLVSHPWRPRPAFCETTCACATVAWVLLLPCFLLCSPPTGQSSCTLPRIGAQRRRICQALPGEVYNIPGGSVCPCT